MNGILMKPLSSITCRKALKARDRIQRELGAYYEARHEQELDAAETTRARANCSRQFGFTDKAIG